MSVTLSSIITVNCTAHRFFDDALFALEASQHLDKSQVKQSNEASYVVVTFVANFAFFEPQRFQLLSRTAISLAFRLASFQCSSESVNQFSLTLLSQ
jgi:hypothetical protein